MQVSARFNVMGWSMGYVSRRGPAYLRVIYRYSPWFSHEPASYPHVAPPATGTGNLDRHGCRRVGDLDDRQHPLAVDGLSILAESLPETFVAGQLGDRVVTYRYYHSEDSNERRLSHVVVA